MRWTPVAVLLALACPSAAVAQDALTLSTAYEMALAADPDIRIAEEALLQSNLKVDQAVAALIPSLTAKGTFGKEWYRDGSEGDSQVYSLTLDETLWNGGRFFIARRGAYGMIRASEQGLSAARQALLLDLLERVYGVLGARDRVDVAVKAVERSREQRRSAEARFAAGEVARNVALDAHAAEAEALYGQVEAEKDLALARSRLADLLGANTLPDPGVPPDATIPGIDLAALRELARRDRPDLKAAAQQVRVAEEQANLTGSYGNPEVKLSASYRTSPDEDVMDFLPETELSLDLRWPFFQGGLVSLQERESRSTAIQAERRRQKLVSAVDLEVEGAVRELTALLTEEELVNRRLESARESHRMARLQFDLGVATGLDVVTAAAQLAEAESREVAHRYRGRVARARLLFAVGGLSIDRFAAATDGVSP